MGMFQHKKAEDKDGPLHFFDDYFREELRQKGRAYYEKVIDDNATLFKKDLNDIVTQAETKLSVHITKELDATLDKVTLKITKQLDEQLTDYGKAMEAAQEDALHKIEQREKELEKQHAELTASLKKSVEQQQKLLVDTYKDAMTRIAELKDAQATALQMINNSSKALEQQYLQMQEILQKSVVQQETMLLDVFQQNMAKIVEHYLLGAIGEELDFKAQMPSIIKQLEANKKEMMDDMKL